MSFKQFDSTNDALSVRKTRSPFTRSLSNMRRDSKVEILSPPREESIGEDRAISPTKSFTSRKSSLKSSNGRKDCDSPRGKNIARNENTVPFDQEQMITAKVSPRRLSSRPSLAKPVEPSRGTPARKLSSPTKETIDTDSGEEQSTDTPGSGSPLRGWKSPGVLKIMTQVDGSPERPQPFRDLDPVVAYQARPNFKILKAHSTMRSQPKMTHINSQRAPTKLRSSVWRSSSRGSATSGNERDDQPLDDEPSDIKKDMVPIDQMDGAADPASSSISCRISLRDLKKENIGRQNGFSSPLSIPKSRLNGSDCQSIPTQPPLTSPAGSLGKPMLTSQRRLTPSASKVKGLAAMFDTAAKASPFVPTPGGAMQKKRRETARVISPYTSNPSPHAPVQTVTSVSTPVSLMSPSKSSFGLQDAADSAGKRSFILRTPNSPLKSNESKTSTTDDQSHPAHSGRTDTRLSVASSIAPSRIPTPSRLSGKKKDSAGEPTVLPQAEGSFRALKSSQELTPQHVTRSTANSRGAILKLTNDARLKYLPRLPQYSTDSICSDDDPLGQNKALVSPSPNVGQNRAQSSLGDRIRSLRSELSTRNEDYAQLQMEFEEFRKMKDISEILLREDLDRVRGEVTKWKRRAEVAERKAEKFEMLAARAIHELQRGRDCDQAQEYSFLSGSDHIDVAEHALQPLTARMNQSVRRAPQVDENCVDPNNFIGDGMSNCSETTILRNITGTSCGDASVTSGGPLWSAVDELVDFVPPGIGFADECV